MTGRRNVFERALALLLALVLVVGLMPASGIFAANAATVTDKVADASTVDTWMDYFLENSNTHAGAVWTDKSVFVDAADFSGVNKLANGTAGSVTMDEDNFLVALSAIAATTQMTGHSSVPTDTVFVLDISSSMSQTDLRDMVDATNGAISQLYETSTYNRIGVVLYNGSSYQLMPIDRYTPATNGTFLTLSDTTISISNGVRDSAGASYSNSQRQGSGTYIQGGMAEALRMFEAVEDTTISAGQLQGGTKRMPILVLMTDGDPTQGTTNYLAPTNNNKTTTGYSTTNFLGFLNQLTASHVRNQMEKHYDRTGLVYTLGLGDLSSVATSVLDPDNSMR